MSSTESSTLRSDARAVSGIMRRLFSACWSECSLMYAVMLFVTSVRAISVPTGLPRNEQSSSEIRVGLAKPLGARGARVASSAVAGRRLRRLFASRIWRVTSRRRTLTSAWRVAWKVLNSARRVRIDSKRDSSETSGVVDTVDASETTGSGAATGAGAGVGVEAADLVDLPDDLVDLPDDFLADEAVLATLVVVAGEAAAAVDFEDFVAVFLAGMV